jgi:hypothetical protein
MDMEQRHHIQTAVALRQLERSLNGVRGGADVPVCEGHEFRAGGRSGSVQRQRDIVRLGEARLLQPRVVLTGEREQTRLPLGGG